MEQILDLLGNYVSEAFELAGYEKDLGKVTISNRPDLVSLISVRARTVILPRPVA